MNFAIKGNFYRHFSDKATNIGQNDKTKKVSKVEKCDNLNGKMKFFLNGKIFPIRKNFPIRFF
jgi:hypothetical protein